MFKFNLAITIALFTIKTYSSFCRKRDAILRKMLFSWSSSYILLATHDGQDITKKINETMEKSGSFQLEKGTLLLLNNLTFAIYDGDDDLKFSDDSEVSLINGSISIYDIQSLLTQ